MSKSGSGSRDEMIRAVKHMIADHDDGKLSADDIDADTFSSYLDTKELPDPDLLMKLLQGFFFLLKIL